MFCTTSETKGDVGAVKHVKAALSYVILAVLRRQFCCGYMLHVFGVRVSVSFHLMFVHIILVRFRLHGGHLLGKTCSFG